MNPLKPLSSAEGVVRKVEIPSLAMTDKESRESGVKSRESRVASR